MSQPCLKNQRLLAPCQTAFDKTVDDAADLFLASHPAIFCSFARLISIRVPRTYGVPEVTFRGLGSQSASRQFAADNVDYRAGQGERDQLPDRRSWYGSATSQAAYSWAGPTRTTGAVVKARR
jgi:hypothetical protein